MQVGQGAGYVYVHQGCCEHLLELTDVRRAHDADPLLVNHYPVVLDQVLSRICLQGQAASVVPVRTEREQCCCMPLFSFLQHAENSCLFVVPANVYN